MSSAPLWMAGVILGLCLSFAGLLKLMVLGYYPSEYALWVAVVFLGLVITVPCHVMYRRTKEPE